MRQIAPLFREARYKTGAYTLTIYLAPVEVSEEESGGESIPFDDRKKNALNEAKAGTDANDGAGDSANDSGGDSDEEGDDV